MKKLQIYDDPLIVRALQQEIIRDKDARYDHRLHALLLVSRGYTCKEVADILGDSVRSIHTWVNRFKKKGLQGLFDLERPGRPRTLNEKDMIDINSALDGTPQDVGIDGLIWNGKCLSDFIEKQIGKDLGIRQSQRLLRSYKP